MTLSGESGMALGSGPSSPSCARVRHITGIRIHRLTAPHSAPPLTVPLTRHARSGSSSTHPNLSVSRRHRAPTLAGEALEHARPAHPSPDSPTHSVVENENEAEKGETVEMEGAPTLARCFVALIALPKVPATPTSPLSPASTTSGGKDYLSHRSLSSSSSTSPMAPFFLSPIHRPSAYPRFALEPASDFAPWLTVEEAAAHRVVFEVWVESSSGSSVKSKRWTMMSKAEVDLRALKRTTAGQALPPNTIEVTLSTEPGVFYIPTKEVEEQVGPGAPNGIVERSMRQTRMKRGVGVGALHQLVNIQAVIADTQKSIADVQTKIDQLLQDDQRTLLEREVSERTNRVQFVRQCVENVEKSISQLEERIAQRREALTGRRAASAAVEETHARLRDHGMSVAEEIRSVEAKRVSLVPSIYHWRAHHVQALDTIFPIQPLNPSTLLYSILGVPLPIPTDPKDSAPPLSSNDGSVNERTTSAALGYAALLLHVLGNLNINGLGAAAGAGLPYPITYAGSKSMVRDVISSMQGARSFPLYAKGVERYRYEYAVFLLNKDIHLLMLESNIRLIDHRHTLPNLKNLLLTLSSAHPPLSTPSSPAWSQAHTFSRPWSRSGTDTASGSGSRQTSGAWTITPTGNSSASSPRRGVTASPTPRRSGLSESLTLSMSATADEEKESEASYF